MRHKVGKFIGCVFGVMAVSVMVAQTVYPCPEYCTQKSLEANYGDDWHLYYFLLGCFTLPESCNGAVDTKGAPAEAFYPMAHVRIR